MKIEKSAPVEVGASSEGKGNQSTRSNMKGFTLTHLNTSPLAQLNTVAISQDEAPTLDQWQYETRGGATCDLDLIFDDGTPVLYAVIRQTRFNQTDGLNGLTLDDVKSLRDALTIVLERGARYAGMRVCPSGVAA